MARPSTAHGVFFFFFLLLFNALSRPNILGFVSFLRLLPAGRLVRPRIVRLPPLLPSKSSIFLLFDDPDKRDDSLDDAPAPFAFIFSLVARFDFVLFLFFYYNGYL